jgi:hypothetical protein
MSDRHHGYILRALSVIVALLIVLTVDKLLLPHFAAHESASERIFSLEFFVMLLIGAGLLSREILKFCRFISSGAKKADAQDTKEQVIEWSMLLLALAASFVIYLSALTWLKQLDSTRREAAFRNSPVLVESSESDSTPPPHSDAPIVRNALREE